MRNKTSKQIALRAFSARQGDVYIQRIDTLPTNLKAKARENGKIILAHGEATGHAHAIESEQVEPWMDDAGVTFLEVKSAVAALKHEEHSTIELPRGNYRVTRQREYTPNQIRNVAD